MVESEALTLGEGDVPALKCTDSQFWPLHVCDDSDGFVYLFFNRADVVDDGLVILVRAVGEIETKDARAGFYEASYGFCCIARRANGSEDFGLWEMLRYGAVHR